MPAVFGQKSNTDSSYFPLRLFPKVQFLHIYEDSSTFLVSTLYHCFDGKTDTFNTYAKVIPNKFDTFKISWYSKQLHSLKEPVLFNKNSSKEVYRFTWLRTFHNPIAIRIEKDSNGYFIAWKVCNGAGGYDPGKLITDKRMPLSENDWNKFQGFLNNIDFWNLKNIPNIPGNDGSHWILEGKTPNKYQVIDRWSPNENNDYFQACNFLISLTGLKIRNSDKY